MSDFNAAWHEQHKMPVRPTDQQRVDWHLEHTRWCGCRPIPARVLAMMAAIQAGAQADPLPAVVHLADTPEPAGRAAEAA